MDACAETTTIGDRVAIEVYFALPHRRNSRVLELPPHYWKHSRAAPNPERLDWPIGPLRIPPALDLDSLRAETSRLRARAHPRLNVADATFLPTGYIGDILPPRVCRPRLLLARERGPQRVARCSERPATWQCESTRFAFRSRHCDSYGGSACCSVASAIHVAARILAPRTPSPLGGSWRCGKAVALVRSVSNQKFTTIR
jgi:hypothetical protein